MPWKQGQSGNPRGRPRKSQKTMAQLRSQISEHLPDVIEVLAGAAKEGDVQAARILVERCVPSMRALDQNINVNESVKGLSDQELIDLMKDFETGIGLFSSAIELCPNDFYGYSRRGLCYMYLDQFGRAKEDFDSAIQCGPSLQDGYAYRATALLQEGHYDDSFVDIEKAIDL